MSIDVHRLAAAERRMLLEMLASLRAGEVALHVGKMFGREGTADGLVVQGMALRSSSQGLVFSALGCHVAETLASRIAGRCIAARFAT